MSNLKADIEEERKEYFRQKAMKISTAEKEKQKYKKEIEILMKCLRPATIEDYVAWLKVRYHFYGNRDFVYVEGPIIDRHYYACANFYLPELRGADSLNIIVPKNVIYTRMNLGHNEIFDFDHGNTTHNFVYVSEEVLKYL